MNVDTTRRVYLRRVGHYLDTSQQHQWQALRCMGTGVPAPVPCYDCIEGDPIFTECIIDVNRPGLGCASCSYTNGSLRMCSLATDRKRETNPSYYARIIYANDKVGEEPEMCEVMHGKGRMSFPAPDIIENVTMAYELDAEDCLRKLHDHTTVMQNQIEALMQVSCASTTTFAAVVRNREKDRVAVEAAGRTYFSSDYDHEDEVTLLYEGLMKVRNGSALTCQTGGDIFALAVAGMENYVEDGDGYKTIG